MTLYAAEPTREAVEYISTSLFGHKEALEDMAAVLAIEWMDVIAGKRLEVTPELLHNIDNLQEGVRCLQETDRHFAQYDWGNSAVHRLSDEDRKLILYAHDLIGELDELIGCFDGMYDLDIEHMDFDRPANKKRPTVCHTVPEPSLLMMN